MFVRVWPWPQLADLSVTDPGPADLMHCSTAALQTSGGESALSVLAWALPAQSGSCQIIINLYFTGR